MSLEKAFKVACEKHEQLKLLDSQWSFDKELISKALQNIGATFPHYSRHDASHSRQIIVNIERMLGDRIAYLSATDMWLLLEAAYSHDIGMVVTNKQIKDLDTKEFKAFVQDICDRDDHDLQPFAKNWIDGVLKLSPGAAAHVLFNEYRQLIAEWYRKKHPENAAKIIMDPFSEIGLSSPRTELLPQRLFHVLAAVCNAHGASFDDVMKLPFSEAGMGTEDCHPRYIAFLLRMGDLLDVDDNRFCPVMMRMVGDALPSDSHAHLEKHQAIRHFRLDTEQIKIEVICPSPDSYEVAHDWFNWLETEYQNQSQFWTDIVPNEHLGRLPTLAPPKVTLVDPYVIIKEGKRPNFDINKDAILKLLRGTGLYARKEDSIREILQNAVDSTIVAIWKKYQNKIVDLNPTSPELIEIYDRYMIEVQFKKKEGDPKKFTLVVVDKGIGIGKADLEHMLRIGNSSKSTKSKLIKEMPGWFKPSGNFGIGLQSIYLLADSFTIRTKSRLSHEAFSLTFSSKKNSSVVIQRLAPEDVEYGASFSVELEFEEFPDSISWPSGSRREEMTRQINEYDFIESSSNLAAYEKFRVLVELEKFNDGSPIKIKAADQQLTVERPKSYFCAEENIVFTDVQFLNSDGVAANKRFRGQPFSELNLGFGLVSYTADFYGYQAMDFLTYNREKILPQARSKAARQLVRAMLEYIEVHFDQLPHDTKPCAAAAYFIYSNTVKDGLRYESDLMRFEIKFENRGLLSLGDVLNKIASGEIVNVMTGSLYRHEKLNGENIAISEDVDIINGQAEESALKLIDYLGTKAGMYWQEQNRDKVFKDIRHWSQDDIQPVDDTTFRRILSGKTSLFAVGKRVLFPAWARYRKLSVSAEISWSRCHHHRGYSGDYLLLPYTFNHKGVRTLDISEKLMNWVYEHRKNADVSLAEIKSLYSDFVSYAENVMRDGDASSSNTGDC